jgi:hypothetical protein
MKTKILANKQELEIESGPLTVMVHQQGIKIKVPDALHVSPKLTVAMAESLNEQQWQHISTGPVFQKYYKLAYDPDALVDIPKTVEDLKDADDGIKHLAGMIIMLVENSPVFTSKTNPKVYLEYIETYLHPKQQRYVLEMVKTLMQDLYGWKKENDNIELGEPSTDTSE